MYQTLIYAVLLTMTGAGVTLLAAYFGAWLADRT